MRRFPFIRFTNWKQEDSLEKEINRREKGFHSYASRIGSKLSEKATRVEEKLDKNVSIHTLHELEASILAMQDDLLHPERMEALFVSIHTLHELEARGSRIEYVNRSHRVSIHTLHELEARLLLLLLGAIHAEEVSIHTLHELEASGINW